MNTNSAYILPCCTDLRTEMVVVQVVLWLVVLPNMRMQHCAKAP